MSCGRTRARSGATTACARAAPAQRARWTCTCCSTPARTVTQVHETADHVADEIHARLPGSVVVIHVEPDGVAGETDLGRRL